MDLKRWTSLHRSAWTTALVGTVLVLLPAPGRAQNYDSEIRIDQLQPASPLSIFTRAEGPVSEFDEGIGFGFRLTGDYAWAPLRAENVANEDEIEPVAHALLLHLGAAIMPLDWLHFELNMPFSTVAVSSGWDGAEDGDPYQVVAGQSVHAASSGVGDLRFGAHLLPVNTKELDVSLGLRFWGPLGDADAYMGGQNGLFRLEATMALAGEVDFFLYGCTIGLAPLFFAGKNGDRAALSCAAHFKVDPTTSLGVEPHVALFSFPAKGLDNNYTPGLAGDNDVAVQFEPMASLRFHISDFRIGLAGGVGLGGAPGTASARAVLTLAYASVAKRTEPEPEELDTDLDGIPDEYDACPKAAGSEERRGCPDKRDLDGDGFIEDDACPEQPGAKYSDPAANGCPDQDNDHTADPVDACPTEPADTGDGCPRFARLKDGDFVIDPPIQFAPESAELASDGLAALVEVISTMRANPKLEQVSVTIGSKGVPAKLTDQRAKAVLDVFNERDVDSNSFEVALSEDLPGGQVTIRVVK